MVCGKLEVEVDPIKKIFSIMAHERRAADDETVLAQLAFQTGLTGDMTTDIRRSKTL